MFRVVKRKVHPTSYVYLASSGISNRLKLLNQYSGHVYAFIGSKIVLVASVQFKNLTGPGGEIKPGETLMEGIARELDEEVPFLADKIMKQLKNGNAVGAWRQSSRGFHNTFMVTLEDLTEQEFYILNEQHMLRVEDEKQNLNRKDHLETDGGMVLVEWNSLLDAIADWEKNGDEPAIKDQAFPLRGAVMFAVAELPFLFKLSKLASYDQRIFNWTQNYYQNFDGVWGIQDNQAVCLSCINCSKVRQMEDNFLQAGLFAKEEELIMRDPNYRVRATNRFLCFKCFQAHLNVLNMVNMTGDDRCFALSLRPLEQYALKIEEQAKRELQNQSNY